MKIINVTDYIPTEEEVEFISQITHRHSPDRKVEGALRFWSKPNLEDIVVADTNLDFEMDLDAGRVPEGLENNNTYQCEGDSSTGMIPDNPDEILGLVFVDRFQATDKNYQPTAFKEVQSRLGLDTEFEPTKTTEE